MSNKSRVKTGFIGFVHCLEKELIEEEKRKEKKRREQRKQESPATNNSQDDPMTKLR